MVLEAQDGALRAALKVARAGVTWLDQEALVLVSASRRWGPALVDLGLMPEDAPSDLAGRPFLATTWTEGVPVAEAARGLSRPRRQTLMWTVAHGAARALEELHGAGVRHGDVKPANVLVAEDASPPSRDAAEARAATLIDLGLATALADEARGGTLRYLAPEVRAGEATGPAADVWALGLALAEIVEPKIAALDPADGAALSRHLEQAGSAWLAALLARAPGARPGAGWVADRAARALGLPLDDEERRASRRARVARSYVGLAAASLGVARPGPRVTGALATWLAPAFTLARRAPTLFAARATDEPFDGLGPLGVARWLVGLVGSSAAAWSASEVSEVALAERLLALAEHVPPEAWTREDVLGDRAVLESAEPVADDPVALARALARVRPDPRALAAVEHAVERGESSASLVAAAAEAMLRIGEIGRAGACLAGAPHGGAELAVLRAEVLRRRGEPELAEPEARRAVDDPHVGPRARALLARLAWDRGDLVRAEEELARGRGASLAEVRGLVAYSRGDVEAGLRAVEAGAVEADGDLALARLEGTRGMLEHARGRARESVAAFARAADLASRAGAVVEEATYLTGLAAGTVDAGEIGIALSAATRAALLWERLGRPAQAARALLARGSALALVGAAHEADVAAAEARARAAAGNDRRAATYARWVLVETRPRGDARARAEALVALGETEPGTEDHVRAAARVLLWAEGEGVGVASTDALAASLPASTRWEWWGARAAATAPDRAVLDALLALVPGPGSASARGPALAAAVRLAEAFSDGEAVRRLEQAREAVAEVVRRATPAAHRASLASVAWLAPSSVASGPSPGLAPSQVQQLETIVRALSSRDRLAPLLAQVVDTMVLWTGVERGMLLLRAPDGRLVPRAARNLGRRDLGGEQLALSTSLARRAMEERSPVVATDAFAQVGDVQASVHALRLRSVLAVPLVARGDVLGVVYLDDRVRRGAFGPGEIAWVRLVASQAALAIADARDQVLLRRAVRRAERVSVRLASELGAREAELSATRTTLAQQEFGTRFRYDGITGRSEPVRAMLKVVDRVTASEVPVLVVGESGTGKELVARAIHDNGARAKRAFVSENCASVPESLLESTLFGHVRGAFTGASSTRAGLFDVADGGTLFLDEIGEMPLAMQTKLLRALQNGEVRPVGSERAHAVDVRIIGATHRDLAAMVAAGTFREDLFYRLDVVTVRVPPLRDRSADIPLLVAHLLDKHAPGRKVKVTRAAIDRLAAFPWPGNVRQLENELRRALVLAEDRIDVGELSEEVARGGKAAARDAGLGLRARVDALETDLVREALVRTQGNQTRAAEALGLSRFGLQKMMRRLGIKPG